MKSLCDSIRSKGTAGQARNVKRQSLQMQLAKGVVRKTLTPTEAAKTYAVNEFVVIITF